MCQRSQIKGGDPTSPNCGERTSGVLIRTVHIKYAATEGARLGVPVGEFDPAVEGAVMDDCVWIQDENIFSFGYTNASVVPFREAQIHAVFNGADSWKILPNKLNRPIGGAVVGDNHFKIDRKCPLIDRSQTIADHLAIVPADNNDGQFQHFSVSLVRRISRQFLQC